MLKATTTCVSLTRLGYKSPSNTGFVFVHCGPKKLHPFTVGRPRVWCGVLCRSSSVLLHTRGALESESHQQLDRCLAAAVWAARHHSNMQHSLLTLAAWKPHQCTSAWRHQLKPTRRNTFIRNQWGTSISWSSMWLKRGQQPAELHGSSNRSVARLF